MTVSLNQIEQNPLKKQLTSRHLSMIAIGGSIGTGLFLASGSAIHDAGLVGAVVAFILVGLMVYCLMTSLAEMTAYQPVTGSFCEYATEYVSPSFGFSMSINYWFNWAITLAAEISAATIIMRYWFPDASLAVVSVVILAAIFILNILSVKSFGESEYWLAMIKVAMIVIFVATGICIIFGLTGKHTTYLSQSFAQSHLLSGHGWLSVMNIMLVAGFSFQGSELVGVAAGESENPQRDIPKATRLIFWRILLFYIFTLVIIGALIPVNNPHLVGSSESNIAFSPFTIIMQMAHIHGAATIMNIVILSAVFSAANSGTYASSRTLYQLAVRNRWKLLSTVNKQGVPTYALLATLAVGGLTLLCSVWGNGALYVWLIAASALSGFIAWVGIAVSHLYFRKAFTSQGKLLKDLPYKTKFFPYPTIFSLLLCCLIIVGQDYRVFICGNINWLEFLLTYSSLLLFVALWGGRALMIYAKSYSENRKYFIPSSYIKLDTGK